MRNDYLREQGPTRGSLKFGLAMFLGDSIDNALIIARTADEAGFDYLWFPDHYFLKDSFVVQTLACAMTQRIKIGAAVTSPFLRHPLAVATGVASLHEFSKGRVVLGIGPGGHEFSSELLFDMRFPRTACKEAIEMIRRAWRGETISYRGKVFSVDHAHLNYDVADANIPIYLAARGPKMVELASEVAEGIITHGVTKDFVEYISRKTGGLASGFGRKASEVDLVISAPISITNEYDKAVNALASYCVYLAGGEYSADFLGFYGLTAEQVKPLKNAVRAGDPNASRLVTREMVNSFCLIGTKHEIISKIEQLESRGLTQLSISIPNSLARQGLASSVRETVERFGKEILTSFSKRDKA